MGLPVVLGLSDVSPWLKETTRKLQNPNVFFHQEIIDFYAYIRPSAAAVQEREAILGSFRALVKERLPESQVVMIGSSATGLFLPGASMDVVLIHKQLKPKALYRLVREMLVISNEFELLDIYRSPKNPMLKLCHLRTGLIIDLSFNDPSGLAFVQETRRAIAHHPELPYLLMILKLFLKQRRLSNTFTGGLGSVLLFSLLLHFCRHYRAHYEQKHGVYSDININLGQYLLEFLKYYSSDFDFRETQIQIGNPQPLHKKMEPNNVLSVVLGMDAEIDVGGVCTKFEEITRIWRNRYQLLTNTKMEAGESILNALINPQKQLFSDFEK